MASFKEILNKDLDTFINPNEFAEMHTIDGYEYPCIIEAVVLSDIDKEPSDLYRMSDGLYKESQVLYIKSDLINKPKYDQTIMVDGQAFTVSKVNDVHGLLEITMVDHEV